ncbi:MAG TPA: helix-turn-helix transcriptional regulator [Candidatus Binatia bacterium]|nr:helix-turn-helix transcriptional regulator [Candidatus Binatia bacterium]
MTPFGQRLRLLREQHGRALKDMARSLKVSSAYLSALEHGHRAQPKPGFVQQVAAYFNLAWEEVDELKALAELSDPKPSIDTSGLSPLATEVANRMKRRIRSLDEPALKAILKQLGK